MTLLNEKKLAVPLANFVQVTGRLEEGNGIGGEKQEWPQAEGVNQAGWKNMEEGNQRGKEWNRRPGA